MKPAAKTTLLAILAAVLLALNLLDSGTGQRLSDTLPILPAIPRDDTTRIEISTAAAKLVMESEAIPGATGIGQDKRRWDLTAPIEGYADQQAVKRLLMTFRKEVPLDVKVDDGNYEEYGLDATNGIVIEIWHSGEAEPAVSFTMGFDGPGNTSFIRMSGDDAVYRARVGGRVRYDKKPAEWRNRVLLDFTPDDVAALETARGGVLQARLVRGESPGVDENNLPLPGPWQLDPDPGFATDTVMAEAIAASLGTMRAGELLGPDFDGGFSPPAATIAVTLANGDERVLEVGSRAASSGVFVRIQGEPDAYRVSSATIVRALSSVADLQDKTLFRFSRQSVDTLGWRRGASGVLLQQDLATQLWRVIEPENMALDIRNVFFTVNTLAELRSDRVVEGISLAEAGLVQEGAEERVVVRFVDGTATSLEIGRPFTNERGRTFFYVRRGGDVQVHAVREDVIKRLRAGFGQG